MTRLFRSEIYGAAAAVFVAVVGYRAGIAYLPSVSLIIAGFLLAGVFAELEDETLMKVKDHTIESHDWHLVLLRLVRTIVLLTIGVLIFAALIPWP